MYTLYLLKYNNYYNRIIKGFSTLQEYINVSYDSMENINFKINDGVYTTQIINKTEVPNYVVVVNNDDETFTRWFVMDTKQNRNGQYVLNLKRDIIVDELKTIIDSPIYIEKGYVSNTNPLILNRENFTCNQIKTKEIQLYDKSGIPWLFIYVNKLTSELVENNDLNIPVSYGTNYLGTNEFIKVTGDDLQSAITSLDSDLGKAWGKYVISTNSYDSSAQYFTNYKLQTLYNTYNGKYVLLNDTNVYKIHFEKFFATDLGAYHELYMIHYLEIPNVTLSESGTKVIPDAFNIYGFSGTQPETGVYIIPFSDLIFDTNILANLGKQIQLTYGSSVLVDVQVLPYNPVYDSDVGINRYLTLSDVQSGYSPTQNYNKEAYLGSYKLYALPVDSSSNYSLAGWVNLYGSKVSTYDNLLKQNVTIKLPAQIINYSDNKMIKNLYNFRLVSPNDNGAFEYNIADMLQSSYAEATLRTFNVSLDYKPYLPYIKVSPAFSGLYGQNFNDTRGLICGGDFSLDQASDAWTDYKLNNKNYQVMFDRQIENMETKHIYNTIGNIAGISSGTLSGVAKGSILGGTAGAIGGGIMSAVGGISDVVMSQLEYGEQLDYTKDMYNYNLQNIQARPQCLTKVSAINSNNKLVPYLEVYTCTSQELAAFQNKITYNGMTINVIGNIANYIQGNTLTYFKGSLIRGSDDTEFLYTNELGRELYKGVFISQEVISNILGDNVIPVTYESGFEILEQSIILNEEIEGGDNNE